MTVTEIKKAFESQFDLVGVIKTTKYLDEALKMKLNVPQTSYPTLVVLGLAYPMRIIKHSDTHLIPSFYTFGDDYHTVLKNRIKSVMKDIPYRYDYGVDNHNHNERLAATLSGLGFFGKNQLIINKEYGSYIFLGLVFIDFEIEEEFILEIDDSCGSCRKCIDACPTNALSENGYNLEQCMSHYNQSKRILNQNEIDSNYALFGCDICQMVCPKNIKKGTKIHKEFNLNGKEKVSIEDLFSLSQKEFKEKYDHMSYLWKGKTILMRNALMVMLRQKNYRYTHLIAQSEKHKYSEWYNEMLRVFLNQIEKP